MPTNIVIPELGESITEGVIQQWLKKAGEYIERDEPVLDLETDKVTMPVPAPAAGVLRHSVQEGQKVKVGSIVGVIDESGKPAAAAEPKAAAPAKGSPAPGAKPDVRAPGQLEDPKPSKDGAAAGANGAAAHDLDIRATPLARKLAIEHNVDLSSITGTGAGGRVREQDVLSAVQGRAGADRNRDGGGAGERRRARRAERVVNSPAPRGARRLFARDCLRCAS